MPDGWLRKTNPSGRGSQKKARVSESALEQSGNRRPAGPRLLQGGSGGGACVAHRRLDAWERHEAQVSKVRASSRGRRTGAPERHIGACGQLAFWVACQRASSSGFSEGQGSAPVVRFDLPDRVGPRSGRLRQLSRATCLGSLCCRCLHGCVFDRLESHPGAGGIRQSSRPSTHAERPVGPPPTTGSGRQCGAPKRSRIGVTYPQDWDRRARAVRVSAVGSLIKKRRKRMRKKKHKKMLKATRWQRRAAGK